MANLNLSIPSSVAKTSFIYVQQVMNILNMPMIVHPYMHFYDSNSSTDIENQVLGADSCTVTILAE